MRHYFTLAPSAALATFVTALVLGSGPAHAQSHEDTVRQMQRDYDPGGPPKLLMVFDRDEMRDGRVVREFTVVAYTRSLEPVQELRAVDRATGEMFAVKRSGILDPIPPDPAMRALIEKQISLKPNEPVPVKRAPNPTREQCVANGGTIQEYPGLGVMCVTPNHPSPASP